MQSVLATRENDLVHNGTKMSPSLNHFNKVAIKYLKLTHAKPHLY